MERFRVEIGHKHKVMPANIVGAIANEAGLESKHIGLINIYEDYSTVDLPRDMPKEIFRDLRKVWVLGQTLKISRESNSGSQSDKGRPALGAQGHGTDAAGKKGNKGDAQAQAEKKVSQQRKVSPGFRPEVRGRNNKQKKPC